MRNARKNAPAITSDGIRVETSCEADAGADLAAPTFSSLFASVLTL